MRDSWKIELLKDTSEVFADGDWIETKDQSLEGIRLVQTGNIGFGCFKNKQDKARFISEETFKKLKCTEVIEGDLLVSRLPDPVGKSCIIPDLDTKMITGVDCTIIRTKKYLLPEYLRFYQMSNNYLSDVKQRVTGTTRSRISRKNLGLIEIPIPPNKEQIEIVEILDQAFESIEKAKANIEKNIENAKELFQSKLNQIFSQTGEGWEEKSFKDILKLKSGDGLTSKKMKEGPYPVYGGNGIAGYHNQYNLDSPQVIIGRVGALCGNVRLVNERFWLTDNAFKISEFLEDFDKKFIVYLLNHKKLRTYARQSAQPVISNSSLKDVLLNFPVSLENQKEIVNTLDIMDNHIQSVLLAYKEELKNLEELKKSILQKAFSGELTNKNKAA